jgi:hypothetical protein
MHALDSSAAAAAVLCLFVLLLVPAYTLTRWPLLPLLLLAAELLRPVHNSNIIEVSAY